MVGSGGKRGTRKWNRDAPWPNKSRSRHRLPRCFLVFEESTVNLVSLDFKGLSIAFDVFDGLMFQDVAIVSSDFIQFRFSLGHSFKTKANRVQIESNGLQQPRIRRRSWKIGKPPERRAWRFSKSIVSVPWIWLRLAGRFFRFF